jgi:hypothetical protein
MDDGPGWAISTSRPAALRFRSAKGKFRLEPIDKAGVQAERKAGLCGQAATSHIRTRDLGDSEELAALLEEEFSYRRIFGQADRPVVRVRCVMHLS